MTMLDFDATTIAPNTGDFEPIPNGRYALQVIEGDVRNNDGKTGVLLKVQIADGEYQGRTFSQYYNIKHPNETAQKIGQGEFSALCHAVAVLQPKAPSEFFGRVFLADVKVTKPSVGKDGKEYGAGNTVQKYYKADGASMGSVVGAIAAPTKKASVPAWAAKAS
jgi:hypothetical protein